MTFSIVVPTRDRPRQLAACLRALARLDYPRDDFEVIVVDDGGAIPPREVIAAVDDQLNVILVTQAPARPAAARNHGASRARGQFLAFTDDDCEPAPDWLRCLASRFASTPRDAIGGHTVNALADNPFAAASQLIVDIVYAHYNRDRARFFASNNLALPADHFHAIRGFDGEMFPFASEDRDLCDRWLHRGYPMTYAVEARVRHAHPLTLFSYCGQHFRYGRGAYRFHLARARRGSGRLRNEFAFYAHLPALLWNRPGAARSLPLLLLWQVANATGFLWEWLSS